MPPLERYDSLYRCGNVAVIPTIDQDIVATAYLRFKREETKRGITVLDHLFYECAITLDQFMHIFLAPLATTFACYHTPTPKLGIRPDLDEWDLVGLGKLNPLTNIGKNYYKTDMCFCFFRQYMRRSISVPVARLLCDLIFEASFSLNGKPRGDKDYLGAQLYAMFGYTPIHNHAMARFSREAGFTVSRLPYYTTWRGEPTDVWVSSLSRPEWESRVEQEKSHQSSEEILVASGSR